MKLTSLATLTALVVRHVYAASPPNDVLTPTGIPATSGLPFSTLSFDTTGASSLISALSSLISSESTAINPYTSPSVSVPTASGSVITPSAVSSAVSSPTATVATLTTSATPTSTATSGARGLPDVNLRSGMAVGIVAVAVAALA